MENVHVKKLSRRLHSLESNMAKLQNIIKRNKLKCFEKKRLSLDNQDGRMNVGTDVTPMDVEDDASAYEDNVNERKVSGKEYICQQAAKSTPVPTFLMITKRDWLYYFLCALVYILCFVASVYYIQSSYDKWQSSPVVQATSNNLVHNKRIPFPAVSICWPDRFKSNYDFYRNVGDCLDCENNVCSLKNQSCDENEMTKLVFAKHICFKLSYEKKISVETLAKGHISDTLDEKEFNTYMDELLPPCETDSVIMLTVYDRSVITTNVTRCDGNNVQQFFAGFSDKVCMTVNSLGHSDIFEDVVVTTLPRLKQNKTKHNPKWSLDNMMVFDGSLNTVPIYGFEEFYILFYQEEKKYEEMCNLRKNNIASIMVHSPNEIPIISESATKLFLRDNINLVISLDPKIILAQDDLLQYSPQQRGCYFAHEKKLDMFKFYTKSYCDLECLVNAFLRVCDCVPFQYPRQNNSVKVCNFECLPPEYDCECLPDCNFISYEIKTKEEEITGMSFLNKSIRGSIAVKFKKNKYYTDVRYGISSVAEFFAFSLGILGGFLGVSVTCVWHLFYDEAIKMHSFIKTVWRKKISPSNQN